MVKTVNNTEIGRVFISETSSSVTDGKIRRILFPDEYVAPQQKLLLLQCFRGLAAFVVVLFHTSVIVRERTGMKFFWHYFRAGATGVDFFFVLSGFIIMWVHARDIGRPASLGRYGWRRFVRVYPLYALCTLALIPIYFAGFGRADKIAASSLLKSFLLLPFPSGQHPIIGQGWTLAHEFLFYLIFASCIVYGAKWALSIGAIFLAGSLVSTLAPLFDITIAGPYWVQHWLFSPYNLEFIGGCAAAGIVRSSPARIMRWFLPLGLALLAIVWTIPSQDINEVLIADDRLTSKMVLMFGIPYILITIGAVAWERHKPIKCPQMLLKMGDATYSIYLTHFVIISALLAVLIRFYGTDRIDHARPLLLVVIAATACIGYGVYRCLELPLLDRLRGMESQIVGKRKS